MSATLEAFRDLQIGPLGAAFLLVYALVLGGAIGSFLNVVAYRLPLGMSLSHPGSRCPWCRRPIRWYHNVPVFGWLILRGRCRDCGVAISPRYPLVELLVALAAMLTLGAAMRPIVSDDQSAYAVDLVGVSLRLTVVFLLFCCALLEFDAQRLPVRLLAVCGSLLLIVMFLVPAVRPIPMPFDPADPPSGQLAYPLLAGALLAALLWPLLVLPSDGGICDALARALLVLLVALTWGGLGLLAAMVVAAVLRTATLWLAPIWPVADRFGWAWALGTATLMWIAIAGPSIGDHELVMRGDTIVQFNERWQNLFVAGLAAALATLVGRAARFARVLGARRKNSS